MLFGFTYHLDLHDTWMHDHEAGWGGEKKIAKLAKLWKENLTHSDVQLSMVI